jgi:hypothetical protein
MAVQRPGVPERLQPPDTAHQLRAGEHAGGFAGQVAEQPQNAGTEVNSRRYLRGALMSVSAGVDRAGGSKAATDLGLQAGRVLRQSEVLAADEQGLSGDDDQIRDPNERRRSAWVPPIKEIVPQGSQRRPTYDPACCPSESTRT